MPDYEVRWSKSAINDLVRLKSFIEPKNPKAAQKSIELLQKTANLLEATPLLGVELGDGSHRRELYPPFGKSGYVVRYRIHKRKKYVLILRIWHSKEKRTATTPLAKWFPV